ncbi:hypothetical protein LTR53_008376 [Teratosphaeriaceae sp. CCFEE 6253]|nr:hypothetical protein LTR53_008376 [Teratosphaeriaceae sp. CCFEE 6253]
MALQEDGLQWIAAKMAADGACNQPRSPPRDNFPLPRELRDMIYSYLLHHEYVQAPPYYNRDPAARSERSELSYRRISTAHTFQYHVNILRVNRQISIEASKALTLNHFVLVTAQWDRLLDIAKHLYDLPVVSEDPQAIAQFTHHHLRVHIAKPTPPHVYLSFVIVGAALPQFCEVLMSWTFATQRVPTRFLSDNLPNKQLGLVLPAAACFMAEAVHTTVKLLSPATTPMTTRLEARLLGPFARMITRLHEVTVIGSTQCPQQIAALQTRMGSRFVSITPFVRQLSDLVSAIKPAVDRLMAAGHFGRALIRYQMIERDAQRLPLATLSQHLVHPESRVTMVILLQKLMDITLTAGFLHFRANDVEKAAESLTRLRALEGLLVTLVPAGEILKHIPGDTIPCHRGWNWLAALSTFARRRDLPTLVPARDILQGLPPGAKHKQ